MKKILIAAIIVLTGLAAFLGLELNSNYSGWAECTDEYQSLLNNYEILTMENEELQEYADTFEEVDYSFVKRYGGMKYPVASGLRLYIGEDPFRIYPSSEAPFSGSFCKNCVVELINEVGSDGEHWCLIIDSRGHSGYVSRDELVPIDEDDELHSVDYGSGNETLGGFRLGDRIETLIGKLDRDYYLAYENGRIYIFPERGSETIDDPFDRPFSEINALDVFADYTNHVVYLRTDSPEFTLKDGYKVGDSAKEVVEFYASKYDAFDNTKQIDWNPDYSFNAEDGVALGFWIDTDQIAEDSIVTKIVLMKIY